MEITKEQVLEIVMWGNSNDRLKIKKWFPEAFKFELEVGKWYFHDKSKSIVNYQGGSTGYGFSSLKNWAPLGYKISWSFKTLTHEWRLASAEEWESALIEEAKKRGYKKTDSIKSLVYEGVLSNFTGDKYDCICKNSLYMGGSCIFKDGVWAEIIKTFSKEEAEKLLGGKII